ETERVEAKRVLVVVCAPLVVWNLLHGLERVVVSLRAAPGDKRLRGSIWLRGTNIGRLEDGSQRTFRGHRVLADELAVAYHHAAEVLGPGAVQGAIDDNPPDLLLPKLRRIRRKP